jgi:head-tail adaptor
MRKDLDTVRERHIAREVRDELRASASDWGWASIHARIGTPRSNERVATGEELARLDHHLRPGTSEGGF